MCRRRHTPLRLRTGVRALLAWARSSLGLSNAAMRMDSLRCGVRWDALPALPHRDCEVRQVEPRCLSVTTAGTAKAAAWTPESSVTIPGRRPWRVEGRPASPWSSVQRPAFTASRPGREPTGSCVSSPPARLRPPQQLFGRSREGGLRAPCGAAATSWAKGEPAGAALWAGRRPGPPLCSSAPVHGASNGRRRRRPLASVEAKTRNARWPARAAESPSTAIRAARAGTAGASTDPWRITRCWPDPPNSLFANAGALASAYLQLSIHDASCLASGTVQCRHRSVLRFWNARRASLAHAALARARSHRMAAVKRLSHSTRHSLPFDEPFVYTPDVADCAAVQQWSVERGGDLN